MAQHEVTVSLPENLRVQRADVEFDIRKDGKKLGTLKVSQGTLEWVPLNKSYGIHIDWEEFAEFMESREAAAV